MKSNQDALALSQLGEITTYQAGVTQSAAHRQLKRLTEAALQPHGISMMHWFIIGTVADAGDAGITVTQLSKVVDTNVPYITNTLNVLASKNIIVRDALESDNRTKRVVIHPDFTDQVMVIEEDVRRQLRKTIYASITPEELLTYINVLKKLNRVS